MKKLLLLLLCTKLSVLAMELPPAAAGKKRPAAAADIEEIKEVKENAPPAKQSRAAKKVYTLKVPVPGSPLTIDEAIDINEVQDVIAAESIAELIESAKLIGADFVLARIPTSFEGKRNVEYYEATNIQKSLFGNLNPPNPNQINKYNLKTPLRAPIAGEIYYYLYFPITDSFDYLGTDYEFFAEGKNPILSNTMLSLIHTQNAHRYYNSLAQLYLEKKQLQKSEYYLEKNLGKLELSPNQKQRLAEVYAKNAGKHYREKRYEKAVKQYSNAYKYGSSDTAGLLAVYSLTNIPRQSITSKILNQSTDIFVELLKKYPEDSLAKLTLEEPSSRATRLYYINKLLSFYLAENISPESKIFLEKKKEELQNLAQ